MLLKGKVQSNNYMQPMSVFDSSGGIPSNPDLPPGGDPLAGLIEFLQNPNTPLDFGAPLTGSIAGAGIGSRIPFGQPATTGIGALLGGAVGTFGGDNLNNLLFGANRGPWQQAQNVGLSLIPFGGLGGFKKINGLLKKVHPVTGEPLNDIFTGEDFSKGFAELEAAQQATGEPYQKAPSILEGLKNKFFPAKQGGEYVPLENRGLGAFASKKQADKFASDLGVTPKMGNSNQLSAALEQKVAPELNKLEPNPLKIETFGEFTNPTDIRLSQGPIKERASQYRGQPFNDYIDTTKQQFKDTGNELDTQFGHAYNFLEGGYGDVKVPGSDLSNTIQEVKKELANVSPDAYPEVRKQVKHLETRINELGNSSGISYSFVNDNRKTIGKLIGKHKINNSEDVQLLGRLYGATDTELQNLAEQAGTKGFAPKELIDKTRQTRAQYKSYKEAEQTNIGKNLSKWEAGGKLPKNTTEFLNQFNDPQDIKAYTKLTKQTPQQVADQIDASILEEQFGPSATAHRVDSNATSTSKDYFQTVDYSNDKISIKKLHTSLIKNQRALISLYAEAEGSLAAGQARYKENVKFVHDATKILNQGNVWQSIYKGINNQVPFGQAKKVVLDTGNLDTVLANPSYSKLFTPEAKALLNKVVQLNNRVSNKAQTTIITRILDSTVDAAASVTPGGKAIKKAVEVFKPEQ